MKLFFATVLLAVAPAKLTPPAHDSIRIELVGAAEEYMFCQLTSDAQKVPYLKCIGVETVKRADTANRRGRDRSDEL